MVMLNDLFLTLLFSAGISQLLIGKPPHLSMGGRKVRNGELAIHGGYYDFVDCAFEKWTLDYKESNLNDKSGKVAVKDRAFWF